MAYSDNIDEMKQQAIRRVKEMQKRSQSVLSGHSESAENKQNKPNNIDSLLSSLLGTKTGNTGKLFDLAGIPIDEEKALIAMLIYILYKQGADVKLLLGLGYLLI